MLTAQMCVANQTQRGVALCDNLIAALDKYGDTQDILDAKRYVSDLKQQITKTKEITIDTSIMDDITKAYYDEQKEAASKLDDDIIKQPIYIEPSQLIQEITEIYTE